MDELMDLDELREQLAKRTERKQLLRRIGRSILVAGIVIAVASGIVWLAPAVLP